MTAVAWAAIALLGATLAVLVGAIFQLGARIDAQTDRIDAHLERHAG
jgi:hypothetical protein